MGWSVLDLWRDPNAGCDAAVSKPHFAALLEIKIDGSEQLTENEAKVKARWQGPYIIAYTVEQAHADLCLEMLKARHWFVPNSLSVKPPNDQ